MATKKGFNLFKQCCVILFIWITLFIFVSSLQGPGPRNEFYPIPKYFGSREKQYLTKEAILYDKPVELLWSTNYCEDDLDNLWMAQKDLHIIQYLRATDKAFINVAGMREKAGNHTGSVLNAEFNGPTSLFVFKKDYTLMLKELNKVTVIIDNTSSDCAKDGFTWSKIATCVTQKGQGGENDIPIIRATTLEKIRHVNLNDLTDDIKPTLASYLTPMNSNYDEILGEEHQAVIQEFTEEKSKYDAADADGGSSNTADKLAYREGTEVYIVDNGNNCIRNLDMEEQEVTVVGGTCDPKEVQSQDGTSDPVFKDGPLGTNRLYHPKTIALDIFGNIFVYDEGNKHIRMIERKKLKNTTRYMSTLLGGACGPSLEERGTQNLLLGIKLTWSSCYRNWIKVSDESSGQVNTGDECLDHQIICEKGGGRSLIRQENSIYVERNLGQTQETS